jgi:hypothetical protein
LHTINEVINQPNQQPQLRMPSSSGTAKDQKQHQLQSELVRLTVSGRYIRVKILYISLAGKSIDVDGGEPLAKSLFLLSGYRARISLILVRNSLELIPAIKRPAHYSFFKYNFQADSQNWIRLTRETQITWPEPFIEDLKLSLGPRSDKALYEEVVRKKEVKRLHILSNLKVAVPCLPNN